MRTLLLLGLLGGFATGCTRTSVVVVTTVVKVDKTNSGNESEIEIESEIEEGLGAVPKGVVPDWMDVNKLLDEDEPAADLFGDRDQVAE